MSESEEIINRIGTNIDPALLEKLHLVPILASLKNDQLVCLEDAEEIRLTDGEFVVQQGEIQHYFWILLEGDLRISQMMLDGNEMALHVLNAGSAFGEISLLANIPNSVQMRSLGNTHLLRLEEDGFWKLMTVCPEVRKAILGNMAMRLQKVQSVAVHQEKMASLGTLAAGLMHELNNPGAAARRAAAQLRENLLRLHALSSKFSQIELSRGQKECMRDLQEQALAMKEPLRMNSLEQSDAEEKLTEWMETANVENAWKLAPTLVSAGIDITELECARNEFPGEIFSDALSWLEALVSSMQLVGTIEESIGRVGDLVHAVKSYAYEGKGQRQTLNVNDSIHATLVILGHKFREKEIVLEKDFAQDLPLLNTEVSGLNQIWTNLLDNAIDAVSPKGRIKIRTWLESINGSGGNSRPYICISVTDNGSGIPITCQKEIFDPFYTTKQMGVGTGLGLGIVHRIVEQFGGRILFSSQPGNTEFVVRLPSGNA
ncbi:ATP-binding protein [Granulicella arctica]|uniref:histidine kinase n=1 Tax=Granulicella arctica TaxID=940613 RepID=A0A7Y9PIQ9_9BACT|nr:ATP-binding protein [Granulicella arctica]NYF80582.1 signal transduction histidine kinase [Granulicella arctica]